MEGQIFTFYIAPGEIIDQTFTLDFLAFDFVQPHRHLNSTPQLLPRDRRADARGVDVGRSVNCRARVRGSTSRESISAKRVHLSPSRQ
jgi:hypothetical protein